MKRTKLAKKDKQKSSTETVTVYWISAVLIFLTVYAGHYFSANYHQSGDSRWSIPTAISIINQGNTDLDEYRDMIEASAYKNVEKVNGHYYNTFPIGVSIIALPFAYLAENTSFLLPDPVSVPINSDPLSVPINSGLESARKFFTRVETFTASIVNAVTAVLLFIIARRFLDTKFSLFPVLIYAFGTSAWSTASRALWQHGPSMLMLTIALLLIILAQEKQYLIQFVSIPLLFSYVIRPTNSVSIILLTIFVLVQYRRYLLNYILWGLIIAIPFLLYNYNVYQSALPPYYMPQRIGSNPQFVEALFANLISPARGLFIYMPIFILSLVGIFLKKQKETLDFFLIGIILLHWITISSFPHWTGGWSYGPRFFSDMIPYFIYFTIPFLAKIPEFNKQLKISVLILTLCLAGVSFFIHYRGATDVQTFLWNAEVDQNISKIWDWHDLQIMRGY